jgi:signal transduction histidine kinase
MLGSAILSASFRFGRDDFAVLRIYTMRLSYFLSAMCVLYNAWGFTRREIVFDIKMEFYVPVQYSEDPWIQGSILSIATIVSLQLFASLVVLGFKYARANSRSKKQILNFVFAAFAIFSMSFMNILVDMKILSNDNYLFLLTNVTFIAVTIVIISVLNQENIPSNVGFKIMTFNITLMYLVLSLIANILFSRYKMDFTSDLEREKDFVKTQIEKGTEHPIVYQSDIVADIDRKTFNINKFQKPFSAFENFHNHIPSYNEFRIEICFSDPAGILWIGDFNANNRHYLMGLSYKDYRRKIHSIVLWLILTLFSTLLAVFLLYPILHKSSIIKPLNRLLDGIHRMQKGDLDTKLEITTYDEIGLITASFNDMIGRVRDSQSNLEQLIRNRTEELHRKLIELKNTQSQLLLAERMSTLGKIAAGVAHEINNPLAAIKASSSFLRNDSAFAKLDFEDSSDPIKNTIHDIVFQKPEDQPTPTISKIKQRRELAAFLKSVGFSDSTDLSDTCYDLGITAISESYRSVLAKDDAKLTFLSAIERKQSLFHLKIIETAIDRASKIVFALKHYSYSGPKENKSVFDLKQGINEVLEMYTNVWKKGTQIDVNITNDIKIFGYPDELVQVWTNLVYNSLQATAKTNGVVEIFSKIDGHNVTVFIKDNGHGIPEENLASIFEPFFTTKELGMGTGLGLPIVKKIIESHGGEVWVESRPGRTVFQVTLPIANS